MPTAKIKRVVAFVDGQALFHGAQEAFGYKTVNYEVKALASAVCRKFDHCNLVQTRFYTGVPSPQKMPNLSHFWTLKLMAMRRQDVHVFAREILHIDKTITLEDGTVQTRLDSHEKGVDMRLGLDIIRLAHEKAYDIALVFSQDQDFTEVVEELKLISRQQSREIKMISAFPDSENRTHRRGIDGTDWIKIDRKTYDACIDPQDYFPVATAVVDKKKTDETRFLERFQSNSGWTARQYIDHLLMLAKMRKLEIRWPSTETQFSVICLFRHEGALFPVLVVTDTGNIQIPLNNRANRLVFRGNGIRSAVIKKFNEIAGVAAKNYPEIEIKDLLNTDKIDSLYDAIDLLLGHIERNTLPTEIQPTLEN